MNTLTQSFSENKISSMDSGDGQSTNLVAQPPASHYIDGYKVLNTRYTQTTNRTEYYSPKGLQSSKNRKSGICKTSKTIHKRKKSFHKNDCSVTTISTTDPFKSMQFTFPSWTFHLVNTSDEVSSDSSSCITSPQPHLNLSSSPSTSRLKVKFKTQKISTPCHTL